MSQWDNNQRCVVVVAGPTASGKSQLAMDLARLFDITIVCGDARQAIRGMRIGAAAPSQEDYSAVPHVGFEVRDPEEEYSAAEYATTTRELISAIPRERLPVVVGGSGLYLQALIDGFSTNVVATPPEIREHVLALFDERGRQECYRLLQSVDPVAADRYADMNPRRVQRALEYFYATGSPLSSTWNLPRNVAPYTTTWIAVDQDNPVLRSHIVARCERMWNEGLIEETQALFDRGIAPTAHIMRTIGYAEAVEVLLGTLSSAKARERLLTTTWQYAKRQRTWFRRDERYVWLRGERDILAHAATQILNGLRAESHS